AVAVVAGIFGYMIGVGFMDLIGLNDLGFITFLVALAVGVVLVIVTFRFNLQKYVIIAASSIAAAPIVVGTIMMGVNGVSLLRSADSPLRALWGASPFMAIVFLVLAVGAILVQVRANRRFEVETYNRLAEIS